MKHCSKCGVVKVLSSFTKNKSRKDGYNSFCRDCHKQYTRKHYEANKDYYKIKAKNRTKNLVEKYWKIKESTPCADCGIKYPHYVMDFDHLSDKIENVSVLIRSASSEILEEELKKCELVCSNCHRERTYKRSIGEIGNHVSLRNLH